MPTKLIATLGPNKSGPLLDLSQGNLTVSTLAACDFHRSVFGTVAQGAGKSAYECFVWSLSQPKSGLVNLFSIGIAADGQCSLTKAAGEEALSYGLRYDGVYNNGIKISSDSGGDEIQPVAEQKCIGVLIDLTATIPYALWALEGNTVFQTNLPTGYFWVPAISIGSTTAGDVSAECNFGQNLLNFPNFTAFK